MSGVLSAKTKLARKISLSLEENLSKKNDSGFSADGGNVACTSDFLIQCIAIDRKSVV